MAAFRAILADEQVLFTEGIKRILEGMDSPKVKVMAAAKTGKDLLEFIEKIDVDIVLTELNFTDMDHEELINRIRSIKPAVKLFILSAYGDIKLVRSCFNKGIDGYALKSHNVETLRTGITDVMQDRIFLGEGLQVAPSIDEKDTGSSGTDSTVRDRFILRQMLTRRELQILGLITSGMNNKQIAKELYISPETVGVHKKSIKKKLDVNSTPSLIRFAKENKLV